MFSAVDRPYDRSLAAEEHACGGESSAHVTMLVDMPYIGSELYIVKTPFGDTIALHAAEQEIALYINDTKRVPQLTRHGLVKNGSKLTILIEQRIRCDNCTP